MATNNKITENTESFSIGIGHKFGLTGAQFFKDFKCMILLETKESLQVHLSMVKFIENE